MHGTLRVKKTNFFLSLAVTQPVFTCSKSAMETTEQCAKSFQS